MPFGFHLSTCTKCFKPFITGDCIEFVCPYCRYDEYMKSKEEKKESDKEIEDAKVNDS